MWQKAGVLLPRGGICRPMATGLFCLPKKLTATPSLRDIISYRMSATSGKHILPKKHQGKQAREIEFSRAGVQSSHEAGGGMGGEGSATS